MSAGADGEHAVAGAGALRARLMLAALCLIWGVTWPAVRIALDEVPPLTMRAAGAGLGALTLFAICRWQRRSLRVPTATAWAHVVVASLLNVVGFVLLTAFAQLAVATSRVTILAYTMPIWTVLLAWAVLGERPTWLQGGAIVLCIAGLAVLIYPLAATGVPPGLLLAIAAGVSWAAGTVHLKWARIPADSMGVACWQLAIAFLVIAPFLLLEGGVDVGAVHARAWLATAFVGIASSGVAYGLWFEIVRRLPAVTASLGVLSVPAIGVVASAVVLGERPTAADIVGFALIFAASAGVVLRPSAAPARPDATGPSPPGATD